MCLDDEPPYPPLRSSDTGWPGWSTVYTPVGYILKVHNSTIYSITSHLQISLILDVYEMLTNRFEPASQIFQADNILSHMRNLISEASTSSSNVTLLENSTVTHIDR